MNETLTLSFMYLLNNLLQVIVTVFFVSQITGLKKSFKMVCGLWLIGMIVLHIIITHFSLTEGIQLFLRMPLGAFILIYFSKGKLSKRIIVYIVTLAFGYLAEIIGTLICSGIYNVDPLSITIDVSSMLFAMLMITDFLFIHLLIIAIVWKRKELLSQKNFGKLGIMLLFTAIHIAITMFYYTDPTVLDNVRHQIVQTILQAILFIALVFNYFNSLHTVKLMESEQNLRHLETEMEHNYMYYSLADEKFTEISRLRHDVLNQIQTVQQLLKTDGEEQSAREIMQNIEQQLVSSKTVHFCQNPIINAVLTVKMNDVKANKIETDIILDDCENLPFENYDVCSLFANIYDNAVEACQKLENNQERFIEMRSGIKNGYFMLKARNSSPDMSEMREGELPKSDKNSKSHGYGTKIIESITKKYDGNFTMHYENGIMQAVVALKTE